MNSRNLVVSNSYALVCTSYFSGVYSYLFVCTRIYSYVSRMCSCGVAIVAKCYGLRIKAIDDWGDYVYIGTSCCTQYKYFNVKNQKISLIKRFWATMARTEFKWFKRVIINLQMLRSLPDLEFRSCNLHGKHQSRFCYQTHTPEQI